MHKLLLTGGFVVSENNLLNKRVRDGLLLDAYGKTLTEKQRQACEMILLQDLSLAEAADILGVSRQGVHDLITRSREHMEEAEKKLGLLDKESRLERIAQLFEDNRPRLPKDFYEKFEEILAVHKG